MRERLVRVDTVANKSVADENKIYEAEKACAEFLSAAYGVSEDDVLNEFDDPFVKETVLQISFSSHDKPEPIIDYFQKEFRRNGWTRRRGILTLERKMCETRVDVYAKEKKQVYVELTIPHVDASELEAGVYVHTGIYMKFYDCSPEDVFGENAIENLNEAYRTNFNGLLQEERR